MAWAKKGKKGLLSALDEFRDITRNHVYDPGLEPLDEGIERRGRIIAAAAERHGLDRKPIDDIVRYILAKTEPDSATFHEAALIMGKLRELCITNEEPK
jgi:hypothetical protein